jgi:hypothetical protein
MQGILAPALSRRRLQTCNIESHSLASRPIRNGPFRPPTHRMTTPTHKLGLGALSLVVPLFAALLAGCTVTTHDDTVVSRCDADTNVACPSPSAGYSCTGDAHPTDHDTSLVCSNGSESGTVVSYCCSSPQAANTCEPDASITSCGDTATPYSCTGSALPTDFDPSLTCGGGVNGPNGTLAYCCSAVGPSSGACSVDTTLESCGDVSTGYRCTGSSTPSDSDPKLVCGDGVDGGNGTEAFCCIDFTSTTCAADPDVVGCTGGSYGFSCTSTASPADEDPSLVCSDPITGADGKSLYCCSQ